MLLVRLASFLVLGGLLIGCSRVRVESTRGPDGSVGWKRVTCSHLDRRCFAAAKAMCPNGYYFASERGGPIPATGGHGAGSPPAGVNATVLPPQETWGDEMYSRKRGSLLVHCAG